MLEINNLSGSIHLRYLYWWAMGLLLIVLGTADALISGWRDIGASALIVSGTVILVIMLGKEIRTEEIPRQDERTRRIGAWGLSYSWFITFITLFILFWIQYLGLITLSVQIVILFLVLEMGISARAFQWYFFKKGDVE